MRRHLDRLASEEFDLLVVGGGVVGAWVAWDASLRGLHVALVEKDDFAGGVSANSLKVIHGGLRYLQRLDLPRVRRSILEQAIWLRVAPHLVEPLPVLVPSYRWGIQRRAILRLALALNHLLGRSRDTGHDPERRLPPGSVLDRAEALDLVPELEAADLTGGLLFHDAQMYSSERLVLELVLAAAERGAAVVNYAELVASPGTEAGVVRVADRMGRRSLEVKARFIVNAAGASVAEVATRVTGRAVPHMPMCVGLNLMFRALGHDVGFALQGTAPNERALVGPKRRQIFVFPWRDRTLVGTGYLPFEGSVDGFGPEEGHAAAFLAEVNPCWNRRPLELSDVVLVHAGLLPADPGAPRGCPRPLDRNRLLDHAREGHPHALSVACVKYTGSRRLAEKAVDLVIERSGIPAGECLTARTPLPGAPEKGLAELRSDARARAGLMEPEDLEHLLRTYGRRFDSVLGCIEGTPGGDERVDPRSPVLWGEMVHAARHEMVERPEDVVWRRTELGATGLASERAASRARTAVDLARSGRS